MNSAFIMFTFSSSYLLINGFIWPSFASSLQMENQAG